jgi:hypothetical protein
MAKMKDSIEDVLVQNNVALAEMEEEVNEPWTDRPEYDNDGNPNE